MIAEYWANGPHTELLSGHWDLFAQFVSNRDEHNVDEDVKMFFVMTNAIFDAGIAAWDAKRSFDSVRPVTAIPFLFQGHILGLGGALSGHGRRGRFTMDSVLAEYLSHPTVSGIHLWAQRLQRCRSRGASLHG